METSAVTLHDSYALSLEERLTAQFYAWERRGRGWQIWSEAVDIEPPFRPFLYHYVSPAPFIDDGRKPTTLQTMWDSLRGKSSIQVLDPVREAEDEPLPEFVETDEQWIECQFSVPPSVKTSKDATDQCMLSLRYARDPLSFEIIGSADAVHVQLVCSKRDHSCVRDQLLAHFPEAVIQEKHGFLATLWDTARTTRTVAVDFGLSREFMLPLRTAKSFDIDPLIGITGALGDLHDGETAIMQFLFKAARYPWAESVMRAVVGNDGTPFFADAPEIVALARQKVAQPLFATTLRIAARARTSGRAREMCRSLAGSLAPLGNAAGNE